MNSVILSGKISELRELDDGTIVAKIKNFDSDLTFDCYWDNNIYDLETLKNQFVTVKGKLAHVQVRENKNIKYKIMIEVGDLIRYEILQRRNISKSN